MFWHALKGVPSFIGFLATIVSISWDPNDTFSARWALLIGLLLLAVIAALVETSWRAIRAATQVLPKVLQSKKPAVGTEPLLLLLEPSPLYSFGDMVTFYQVSDDSFEDLIGVGAIVNVQQDGKIHALLQRPVPEFSNLIEQLTKNDAALRDRIRVKPNVQRAHAMPITEQG